MPTERTTVTELGTALGTLPHPTLTAALVSRTPALRLDPAQWERLSALYNRREFVTDFRTAYSNGRAFAQSPDALRGRPPRIIEWTGGRKPTGDEVAPIDLRIDHVYMVSCKYLSANVANSSPARLFDGLLATAGARRSTDWFHEVAPDEYQALYEAYVHSVRAEELPADAAHLSSPQRRRLQTLIRSAPRDDTGIRQAYAHLCDVVSRVSAQRWRTALATIRPEAMLWRLLRIGNAPYFLLGAHGHDTLRLRVLTTWDWGDAFELRDLGVSAIPAGQPKVEWAARYRARSGHSDIHMVRGHVEVRWSHGPFGNPPEAKVYLDSPIPQVPGYHPLGDGPAATLSF